MQVREHRDAQRVLGERRAPTCRSVCLAKLTHRENSTHSFVEPRLRVIKPTPGLLCEEERRPLARAGPISRRNRLRKPEKSPLGR